MTASHDKTLFDKTVTQRVRNSSRRTRRIAGATVSLVAVATVGAASLAPVEAQVRTAADIGGFATMATAAPLKIEIYEPVIPIPTEPQSEIDFSYTKVTGESGPTSTARASALWPGSGLGEGAKTFGDQLGIPASLTAGGYPAQVNAGYPGENTKASQEPVPGAYSRVEAGEKETVAAASYSTSAPNTSGAGSSSGGATGGLPDLTKLGDAITGAASGGAGLGALSTLVNISGVTSISKTTYDSKGATAIATSHVGEISVALGLIKLEGVHVVLTTTATMDGVKTTQKINVGAVEIAGQQFAYGPNGLTAAGSNTPASASEGGQAAKDAGITFDVSKPQVISEGTSGSIDAQAMVVTIDVAALKSKLPSLPLDPITGLIPSTGTQLDLLTGILRSVGAVAPKLVLRMGQASTSAMVVPAFDMGTEDPATTDTATTDPAAGTPAGTDPAADAAKDSGVPSGEIPPAAAGGEDPITSEEINPMSSIPGLPPLGSVPMWLILGGLLLGAGVGWYMRHAGIVLFGGSGAGTCNYGLKAGIPDLRKV